MPRTDPGEPEKQLMNEIEIAELAKLPTQATTSRIERSVKFGNVFVVSIGGQEVAVRVKPRRGRRSVRLSIESAGVVIKIMSE